MFYLYYNDTGAILSVSNSKGEPGSMMSIDKEMFNEFSEGHKEIFDYKVIEDVTENGVMHVVPLHVDFIDQIKHHKGKNKKTNDVIDDCIQFLQYPDKWVIKNHLTPATQSILASNDCIRDYYVTCGQNRFILYTTFQINLQELIDNDIVIEGHYCEKDVSLLCNSSYINHIHTLAGELF